MFNNCFLNELNTNILDWRLIFLRICLKAPLKNAFNTRLDCLRLNRTLVNKTISTPQHTHRIELNWTKQNRTYCFHSGHTPTTVVLLIQQRKFRIVVLIMMLLLLSLSLTVIMTTKTAMMITTPQKCSKCTRQHSHTWTHAKLK